MSAPLRVAVVGAGAIGGFLAAHLGRAGAEVHVLARGATLEVLRETGVTLVSDEGRLAVRPARVSEDAADLGPVDLCLFTVKGQDSAQAARAMAPLMGPDTRALSFQNGLHGVELLARTFGADRVLAGVTYVPARVERPGEVVHTGAVRRFVFGPFAPGAAAPSERSLAETGRAAGLEMDRLEDPMPAIWAKFVMLTAFHMVSTLTRLPLGGWIDVAETRALYARAMEEVAAVARARGVALPGTLVEDNLAFTVNIADPRTRASMLDDLERGRPLELEATIGWLVREADRLGVPVPLHRTGRALLLPHLGGMPG